MVALRERLTGPGPVLTYRGLLRDPILHKSSRLLMFRYGFHVSAPEAGGPVSGVRAMKTEDRGAFRGSGHLLGVGIGFLTECGLFAALGWWLDGRFETNPWLLVTGVMLGFGYATWNLLRQTGGGAGPAEKKGEDA